MICRRCNLRPATDGPYCAECIATAQPRFLPTGNAARARRMVAAVDAYRALVRMGARPALRDVDTGHAHGPGRKCRACPEETAHLHGVYCAAHTFSNLSR